jgi:outer membrane protein assembly factor BamA
MTSIFVLCAWLLGAAPQAVSPGEVIADIRVHGNHLTEDAEVIRLSGLAKGSSVTDSTIPSALKRLNDSGKFDDVEVLKRFASIEDPTQILIMLIVNEGPVRIDVPSGPGAVGAKPRIVTRGVLGRLMYMPVIDHEDGYAVRFGVQVAYVPSAKSKARLSFPFTWGGERRAGAEWEKGFDHGRVQVGGALTSSVHPFFQQKDARRQAWARAEVSALNMHLGATGSVQSVHFGGTRDTLKSVAADVTIDTRLDPVMPRNAIYVFGRAEAVRIAPDGAQGSVPSAVDRVRTKIDVSGYLGTFRQTVLVARVVREDISASAPPYFKAMLGGMSNLRGFEAGQFVGDTLVAGTVEVRTPITSPVNVGKLGIRAFMDAGTVYDKGQRYRDQTLKQGYGAGLFFTAAIFHMNLDVAHGKGAGTRVHFGGGFSF